MPHASGSFNVKAAPVWTEEHGDGTRLARLSLDKEFLGDLAATSRGEMLSAVTSVKGSAGYVAIERVSGTLHGRSGSFVLQHSGVMNRGAPHLSLDVVPDSGSGELSGLAGSMQIIVTDGEHAYEFSYTLSAAVTPAFSITRLLASRAEAWKNCGTA